MALPGPGAGRGCGHDVADDWTVSAHCGKRTERGPSSISHVGSALTHLGKPRVQPSKGAVFSDRPERDTALAGQQPSPNPWSTRDSPALIIKDEDLTLLRMPSQ